MNKTSAIIFVYDTTSSEHSEFNEETKKLLLKHKSKVIIVGNKSDLTQFWNRKLINNILQFCCDNELIHVFTSALVEEGINDILRASKML